jgi:hypothetical protein
MTHNSHFNPDEFSAPQMGLTSLRQGCPRRPPRHRQGEEFLKGPIPWPWLERAMILPGKALQVALAIWKQAGCQRSRTVRFCLSQGSMWGASAQTTRRGLRALASAGLVTISYPTGRALEVTILDATAE